MKHGSMFRVLALGIYAAALATTPPVVLAQAAPAASHPYAASQPITGRYIVVLKDSVANPAAEAANLTRGPGVQLHHTYSSAIKGFAASLPAAALQGIRNNPNVDYIEQDQTVSLNETEMQTGATWGLDRIDERSLALGGLYQYNHDGAGVKAFIIDTGIRPGHVEFFDRLLPGYNVITDSNGTSDCNGHGTHVAGTVGGTTWGVAKKVSLIPVRVLNCRGSGSWSGVIAGIDWVATQASRTIEPMKPAVANMSLGGGASTAVDNAVAGAVSKGVTMVVAAGNSNANACNYSPARAPSAITVGATTRTDTRASYSNYGTCLDLFAPGSDITSAWNTSNDASNTISGTSMASPHVTGVAALALAANPSASPWAVADFLTANATSGQIVSPGPGSLNRLVFSLSTGSPQEPIGQTLVAVSDMAPSKTSYSNGWRASVTVTVAIPNEGGVAWGDTVSGATVVGSFSPGGTASCVTGNSGNCKLTSATISKNTPQTKFTVTGVSGQLMNYDSSKNTPTEITILKP